MISLFSKDIYSQRPKPMDFKYYFFLKKIQLLFLPFKAWIIFIHYLLNFIKKWRQYLIHFQSKFHHDNYQQFFTMDSPKPEDLSLLVNDWNVLNILPWSSLAIQGHYQLRKI
jgi:hypothetical protein